MDFALILLMALVVTGGIAFWDKLRSRSDRSEEGSAKAREQDAMAGGNRRQSVIVEYARAFFPVILVVFVLRSFVIEPFRIPSGSMLPTLFIGDFILVDKFRYGIRLPVINILVFPIRPPRRGEVMVFRYPHDNKTNFIKRVIGVPGDEIIYDQKQLYINNSAVDLTETDRFELQAALKQYDVIEYSEVIDASIHTILNDRDRPARNMRISVPPDSYFVMGDNRDHSNDSRFWGFVPEQNIVGRAFLVWFSWNSNDGGVNWSRIGYRIP